MTNEEKKEFLKKEKARLELSKQLVDFSKYMSDTVTKGFIDSVEKEKINTEKNIFTYKKGHWIWK